MIPLKYQVIKKFRDKYTKELYLPGKIIELDDTERIADLQKRKLIGKALDEPIQPKHVGGGYYELPDGTRVKGKEAAIEALKGGDKDD